MFQLTRRFCSKFRSKKPIDVLVDRSGLIGVNYEGSNQTATPNSKSLKEQITPLAKELLSYIKIRGPITLHEFMTQAVNNRSHGYYQQNEDKIGVEGDFVTSPEISQLFGEMICLWCISLWKILGSPPEINLVELGPGNGTLMSDITRVASRFSKFKNALRVHLVELSPSLQSKQAIALGCTDVNHNTTSSNIPDAEVEEFSPGPSSISKNGIPVQWHKFIRSVPEGIAIIIAQEFLDTFPIHQFRNMRISLPESNENSSSNNVNMKEDVTDLSSWKEILVDVDETAESPLHFRLVVSPKITPATRILLQSHHKDYNSNNNNNSSSNISSSDNVIMEPNKIKTNSLSTKQSKMVPLVDNRGNSLGDGGEGLQLDPSLNIPAASEGVEISPMTQAVVMAVASRISKHGGGALFIDYGENYPQADTLRAFKQHKQVHPLSSPGEVDLTADVDFAAASGAARDAGASVLGPISQGEFLVNMGMIERVQQLIDLPSTTEEQAQELFDAVHVLAGDRVGLNDMGSRFKVLGLVSIPSAKDNSSVLAAIPGFPSHPS